MVQKKSSRRSSLIMGVLLALLPGMAAAFFVLAVPIGMLETVTTMSRLSKLMVQAEPPISPNDRTLLAILAGVLTSGIGWVMVDWLIFGRAGMGLLIRTREDDYEDEGEDHFRPTDPLDLVASGAPPPQDWTMPQPGDARRPLSARNDIGDPPLVSPFDSPLGGVGANQALPPLGGILPGEGVMPPALQPNVPPPVQPAPQLSARPMASPHMAAGAEGLPDLELPPLGRAGGSSPLPDRGQSPVGSPTGMPSWIPAPGSRPEERDEIVPADIAPEPREQTPAADEPVLQLDEPSILPPQAPRAVPPLIEVAPPTPPSLADIASDIPPVWAAPAQEAQPASEPEPVVSHEEVKPAAPDTPVAPLPPQAAPEVAPRSQAPRPSPGPMPEPGFDRARLEDLLERLERGLQQRRARAAVEAASAVQQAHVAPPVTPPAPPVTPPAPPLVEPPVGIAPRPIPPAAFEPPAAVEELSPFAEPPAGFSDQLSALPPVFDPAPTHQPPAAPEPSQPRPPVVPPLGGSNDEMLDQPLHVTLDALRNMVKR